MPTAMRRCLRLLVGTTLADAPPNASRLNRNVRRLGMRRAVVPH